MGITLPRSNSTFGGPSGSAQNSSSVIRPRDAIGGVCTAVVMMSGLYETAAAPSNEVEAFATSARAARPKEKMRRTLLAALVALSILLALALAILWHRSYANPNS